MDEETMWKDKGCKFFVAKGKRYLLFWLGTKEKIDGVGIFVAEKRANSVVGEERQRKSNDRKVGDVDRLLTVFSVYAPHSGKAYEKKRVS